MHIYPSAPTLPTTCPGEWRISAFADLSKGNLRATVSRMGVEEEEEEAMGEGEENTL